MKLSLNRVELEIGLLGVRLSAIGGSLIGPPVTFWDEPNRISGLRSSAPRASRPRLGVSLDAPDPPSLPVGLPYSLRRMCLCAGSAALPRGRIGYERARRWLKTHPAWRGIIMPASQPDLDGT